MITALLDKAPLLFFTFSDNGILKDVNATACLQLGYDRTELNGQNIDKIFTIATRIFHQTHLFPLLKMQGTAPEIYITLQTKTGEQLPVLFNFERASDGSAELNTAAGIIVHNRKKFEDELVAAKRVAETALNENTQLRSTQEQLQKHAEQLDDQLYLVSKQNSELRQFSRVVTHDLQEPLRKLLVFASILETLEDPQDVKKTVTRISRVLLQMQKVISSLQQYVWINESAPLLENVDLDKLAVEVISELKNEYSNVRINTNVEKMGVVHADPEQMKFVLKEILNNAVSFRKNDAVNIDISVKKIQRNKFRRLDGRYQYGDFLKLEISDNGSGIESSYSPFVFDLFKKFHPNSGYGVGLSLCRKIIESSNGMIDVESVPHHGTTVNIYWPA